MTLIHESCSDDVTIWILASMADTFSRQPVQFSSVSKFISSGKTLSFVLIDHQAKEMKCMSATLVSSLKKTERLKRVKLGNNKADDFANWVESFIQTLLFG